MIIKDCTIVFDGIENALGFSAQDQEKLRNKLLN